MYLIKYEDNNKTITCHKKFKSNEEADTYISENLKDKEAWVEETENIKKKSNINLSTFLNKWIYLYSKKKNTFYSYGKLAKCNKFYGEFQTKPESTDSDLSFSHITIDTINNLIDEKKAYFLESGEFVNLKEYT